MKNKFFIHLIEGYQQGKNPNTPPKCRYYPSCSNYAMDAFKKYNFIKAGLLTLFRLLRCTPLFKGGYDPIPLSIKEKNKFRKEHKGIYFIDQTKIK